LIIHAIIIAFRVDNRTTETKASEIVQFAGFTNKYLKVKINVILGG